MSERDFMESTEISFCKCISCEGIITLYITVLSFRVSFATIASLFVKDSHHLENVTFQ